jgi:hypothetical protein
MPFKSIKRNFKMAEETNDANGIQTTDDTGSSPDVETFEPITDDEGLASTTEFAVVEPEKEEPTEEANEDTDTSEGAEQNTPKDESSKDFHQHPDWINREKTHNAAIQKSNDRIAALEKKLADGEKTTKSELQIDWTNDEKIIESFTENPKLFVSEMFQQFQNERDRLQNIKTEKATQEEKANAEKTRLTDYFTKTEGALEMWEDGSIQKYMDENPGETAISAHRALSEESRIKTMVDEAVKTAREKWKEELKLKGRAGSLANNANPPKQVDTHEDELKHPDKHGGKKNVLVKRLKRFMAAS